jgi:hypothetical protein
VKILLKEPPKKTNKNKNKKDQMFSAVEKQWDDAMCLPWNVRITKVVVSLLKDLHKQTTSIR